MATQRESPELPGDEKPPFLQEVTAIVEPQPDLARSERLVEATDRWRLALVAALVPVVLIAIALAGGTSPSNDGIGLDVSSEQTSAVASMVRRVVPTSVSGPADGAVDGGAPTSQSVPPPAVPPSVAEEPSTGTDATVASSVGPEAIRCLVAVDERSELRAEPNENAPLLAAVAAGAYAGYESRDEGLWYRIDVDGTTGWIPGSVVSEIRGVCDR